MTAPCLNIAGDMLAEHSSLVSRMHTSWSQHRQLITSSLYDAPEEPSIKIRRWKMSEQGYYERPCPFPTLARGVFTQWLPADDGLPEGEGNGHWRIVARGYDKFFSVGETDWTSWSSLEINTDGPYDLTLKSNGCIIFIAALTPDKLLVTSKHSLGPARDRPVSHAEMGERWLKKHLEAVGRTQAQLAARLWKDNWTAVCELCDDMFEEHVLPVAADKSGLRLHGINTSQPAFETQPPEFVETFAKEWGLIPTAYLTLNSIAEVHEFTDDCAETGSWNGEAIEGFVVRTGATREQSQNEPNGNARKYTPPYPPGSSFFFKVKFDEPYMMYRDFREITKTLLRGIWHGELPNMSHSRLRRPETRVYRRWVESELKRDLKQFDGFLQSRGIIATRDRFFAWLDTTAGKEVLAAERMHKRIAIPRVMTTNVSSTNVNSADGPKSKSKWIIVPVAIPGCGKTTIAVALSRLFGFAHTQSDDVITKNPAPAFLAHVAKLLQQNDVVIADKNNHLFQHRLGLRRVVENFKPPVKLLALDWAATKHPPSTVHRICTDRIMARGRNHQSLIPGDDGVHESVLWRFLRESNALAKDEVDESIDMDVEEGLDDTLARAVDGIVSALGLAKPSQEQIDEASRRARAHQATAKVASAPAKEDPRHHTWLPHADLPTSEDTTLSHRTRPLPDSVGRYVQGGPDGISPNGPSASREQRWIILLFGLPGSGSTRICAELEAQFGFRRPAKSKLITLNGAASTIFAQEVAMLLHDNRVVIADRHNRFLAERQELRKQCSGLAPKLLAFCWDLSGKSAAAASRICSNRLRMHSTSPSRAFSRTAEATVMHFIREFEQPRPGEFDVQVDLRVEDDFSTTLACVIGAIRDIACIQAPLMTAQSFSAVTTGELVAPDFSSARSCIDIATASVATPTPSPCHASQTTSITAHPAAITLHQGVLAALDKTTSLVYDLMLSADGARQRVTFHSFLTTPGTVVTCWKAQRDAVYEIPCRLPISSSGLWTEEVTSYETIRYSGRVHAHRIVARGYDKVFALNETPWTTWKSIEYYMDPPFHVTPRLSGCLILISALSPNRLLVTSKYSHGPAQRGSRPSHAQLGEKLLVAQLSKSRKTPGQLARYLWQNQWTMLCELCGDNSEGISPMPASRQGLNLHGINHCTVAFETEDVEVVTACAKEWGFIPVEIVTLASTTDLHTFVSARQQPGRPSAVEDVMVRARVASVNGLNGDNYRGLPFPPPYSCGSTMFFKVIFAQNTLTRALQDSTRSRKPRENFAALPEDVYRLPQFHAYQIWLSQRLQEDASLFGQRRGVATAREHFDRWITTDAGKVTLREAYVQHVRVPRRLYKFSYGAPDRSLIFPIGLPGCGKTSVLAVLGHVFGFKHVKRDSTKTKSSRLARQRCISETARALRSRSVVVCDGVFHRADSRKRLRKHTEGLNTAVSLIALQWAAPPESISAAVRTCSERFTSSGPHGPGERERLLRRYLTEFEEPRFDEYDARIILGYDQSLRDSAHHAVFNIARLLSVKAPPESVVDEALRLIHPGNAM